MHGRSGHWVKNQGNTVMLSVVRRRPSRVCNDNGGDNAGDCSVVQYESDGDDPSHKPILDLARFVLSTVHTNTY
jgi:hypothetical protein